MGQKDGNDFSFDVPTSLLSSFCQFYKNKQAHRRWGNGRNFPVCANGGKAPKEISVIFTKLDKGLIDFGLLVGSVEVNRYEYMRHGFVG